MAKSFPEKATKKKTNKKHLYKYDFFFLQFVENDMLPNLYNYVWPLHKLF